MVSHPCSFSTQTILPLIDIFLLHPSVLFLLWSRRKMRADIRIGYASTVIGFMLADAVIFGLRVHLLSPFGGIYCGGPLCREGRVDLAIIRVLLSLTILCCLPFFVFLTLRMHQLVLRGGTSKWILSSRCE
ncbi:hypothetical protein PMAYCL1PPCAC_15642, partial [Pristionchus mayeri]